MNGNLYATSGTIANFHIYPNGYFGTIGYSTTDNKYYGLAIDTRINAFAEK
jgi:hypothetical protein